MRRMVQYFVAIMLLVSGSELLAGGFICGKVVLADTHLYYAMFAAAQPQGSTNLQGTFVDSGLNPQGGVISNFVACQRFDFAFNHGNGTFYYKCVSQGCDKVVCQEPNNPNVSLVLEECRGFL